MKKSTALSRKEKEKILMEMALDQKEALVILREEQAKNADPNTGSDFEKHYKKGDFQSERPAKK